MKMLSFIYLLLFLTQVKCQIEGIYCGKETCYDVLGVERDADRQTITKAYRKLARDVHPDRQKNKDDREAAEVAFRRVANAYEILRDEEQRREYDYMLDNPDSMYYHYYSYYRRIYAPKVDVRIVLAVIISLISIAQYYRMAVNYRVAVTELTKTQMYRNQAKQIAQERGLMDFGKKDAHGRRYTKEQIKEMEEMVLQQIVEENIDIRGGYARPSVWNTLWLQLVCLPLILWRWIYFYLRWFYLFILLRQEYGREEKLYLIRRNMGIGAVRFQLFSEIQLEEFLKKELWIRKTYLAYKQEISDSMRAKNAEDPRYKRYRRYMRKGGPGQISFDADE